MGKYDKILLLGLVIINTLYYVFIKQLPEKAARYPLFVSGLMSVLIIIFAIETFLSKKKYEKKLFEGFKAGQFFFILVVSGIYIYIIDIIGFFVSTLIYLIVIMLGLKAKPVWAVVSSVLFCIIIYLVFVMFLKVPVPNGFLI